MDKPLKKRSEIAKKKADAPKPSAAERTVPLPGTAPPANPVPGTVYCKECEKGSKLSDCTRRASGEIECANCGAPIPLEGAPPEMREAVKPPDAPRDMEWKNPVYCDQCGAKWPIIDGRPFPNCGHDKGFVTDPRKAKKWNPPAGHPRPDAEAAPEAPPPAKEEKSAPAPRISVKAVEGGPPGFVKHQIEWGKVTFQERTYSTIGPFAIFVDVPVEDASDPAKMDRYFDAWLDHLERLATKAFQRQRSWFRRRMKEIEEEQG